MFWPAVLVATLGNTVGGAIDWWMGYAAKLAVVRYRLRRQNRQHEREHEQHLEHPKKASKPALDAKYFRWMRRWGPPTMLVSWLPGIGDPLCTLAGWLRMPFWPSVGYTAIGKFLRYLAMTGSLLWIPDSFWHGVDVRGAALSLVVIDKLPFSPPDDPVLAARIEQLNREGRSAFFEFQLPEAVITLKQGAGRLIRDEGDRGVLMICDPRLLSRGYSKRILQSLPPMRLTREAAEAVEFFGKRASPTDHAGLRE